MEVQKATYGSGSSKVDVTSNVSKAIEDGKIHLLVSPASLNVNDPLPGVPKQLAVSYTINDESKVATVSDGDIFSASVPAEKKDKSTPTQHVYSILGSLSRGLFWLLITFLYVASLTITVYVTGAWYGYILGAIPFFGITVLPFLLLVRSFFYDIPLLI